MTVGKKLPRRRRKCVLLAVGARVVRRQSGVQVSLAPLVVLDLAVVDLFVGVRPVRHLVNLGHVSRLIENVRHRVLRCARPDVGRIVCSDVLFLSLVDFHSLPDRVSHLDLVQSKQFACYD